MKKYFLGLMAVVIAVGFSAFDLKPTKTTEEKQTQYFWYNVDQSTGLTTSLAHPGMLSEDDAKDVGCDDSVNSNPVCYAGFPSQVGSGVAIPSDESRLIRKTNP